MAKEQAISLKPEDMTTGGGGILADTNAKWLKVEFGMEDYRGKMTPVPAFKLHYLDLDQNEEFDQSWSVGSADDYTPSKDGKKINGTKAIRASSNFGMLLASLSNAIGAEELSEHITDDITVLAGMETHFFQQEDTRPTAKPRKDPNTGKSYPATIPLVDKVMVKPWDKKASSGGGGAADDDDLKATATEIIKKILADNPNGMDKQTMAVQVFQDCQDPNVVSLISNDDAFLGGIDGVTLEGNVLKLA